MHKKTGAITISQRCELTCLFCGGNKRKKTDDELREEEIKVYKNLQYLKRDGLKKIEISGSDPIEYEEIIGLIQYIKKQGFEWIQLSTHGTKLSDPSFLNKLIKSGVDKLRIPIYGSKAKIHDSITRTPGSFNKVTAGIKAVLKKTATIKIQISCLIMEQNKKDLLNMVDFVNNLGIKDLYFSVPCLQEKDISFYIPFKELSPYAKKLYKYALKVNDNIKFKEIPFCIFGKFDLNHIESQCYPPNLGKYNQPPEQVRTSTPDLPSYRLKRKINICKGCQAFNNCDGFFVNDINKFGIGKIKKL